MKKYSKLMALVLVVVCFCTTIIPASAAHVVKTIDAGEFGTLTGTLYDSYADLTYAVDTGEEILFYEFSYGTGVTRSPADWATIHADVALYNQATGIRLYEEGSMDTCEYGNLYSGYYCEMDGISGIRGENGITITVFGCHEVRYYDSYVAYTKKTYNLERDHGII